ncbi:hypothetical protein Y032_0005g2277 [Ancylostoma ceylanicum]|uniref:Regulatory protein zeste n=1 Tax=Ancylostoma ceylanicum TaxID=53326 RepID=A0A016VSR3_9BILA|nr:hypothetical protein Y032_0005g2277 [Ancylostoma ceylanicum]
MENVNVDAENARKKAPAFQECEVRLLMTLYTDSFEQFHRKFKGAGKTGPSDRSNLLRQFTREVSNLGVWERSEKQIEERIKTDTKRVRKHLSEEKGKLNGTGGDPGPSNYKCSKRCSEEDQYPQYVRSVEECQPPQPSSPSPVECLDENQEEMDVEQGHTEECTPQRLTCTPRRKSKRVTHAARAREVLSLFTDRRQQWYEEERKLAVMRQEQAEEEKKLLKIKQDIAQAQLEHYLTSSYGHY